MAARRDRLPSIASKPTKSSRHGRCQGRAHVSDVEHDLSALDTADALPYRQLFDISGARDFQPVEKPVGTR
jgi:hypothetical protein